jgi:hypothetical protein
MKEINSNRRAPNKEHRMKSQSVINIFSLGGKISAMTIIKH